jgi:aryl-alcohol dehydrogenase-like predicted oxidoreductase
MEVSMVGLGAGAIGALELSEGEVERLLATAVEQGVTLFDTARSYGASEDRLGRILRPHRARLILSTKVGYDIPGCADWTAACIRAGVDAALARLRTDCIDIVHLHSCPIALLERGEITSALEEARRAGKVRVAAYSGDGEALAWAVASGHFGAVQCSASACDQAALEASIPAARDRGLGVIGKRPLANAPWRFATPPAGAEAEPYWERWRAMGVELGTEDPLDVFLRFAVFSSGVDSAIVGTHSPDHLMAALAAARRGPLPDLLVGRLRASFQTAGPWPGRI